MVLMEPPLAILRIRLFHTSATYRLPLLSSAIPQGPPSSALVAALPSPANPNDPVPAMVVIMLLLSVVVVVTPLGAVVVTDGLVLGVALRMRLSPNSAMY